MKYNVKDLQRALEKVGGNAEVDISLDPRDRLILTFTDTMGGDKVEITIFKAEINMMPTITRTERL